jgi:small subunit ribosomal protein S8
MTKINNFVNNVKNTHINFKHFVKYPASNLIIEICNLLLTENFIRGYFIEKNNKKNLAVVVLLKYNMNKKVFSQIFTKTKRSRLNELKKNSKFMNGFGIEVISTIKGITTNSKSLKLNLGGQKILQLF